MARFIDTEMNYKSIHPKNGKTFGLKELYKLIGCELIEVIHLGDGNILIVDEEGAINGSVLNQRVSRALGHPIFGNAVFCKETELE